MVKRLLLGAAACASMACSSNSFGDTLPINTGNGLTLVQSYSKDAPAEATEQAEKATSGDQLSKPFFMDAMPAEAPNIHGFAAISFNTAYVTPRGLVVQNSGLVIQPVAGLVLPVGDFGPVKDVALVTGVWNSIDTAESESPSVGPWDEMDFFFSVSGKVSDFTGTLTYGAWNFPQHAANTEHNIDLKISYDDTKFWNGSGFSLHPYIDLWWAVSGNSTVILGDRGDTGYVELGVVPSYTYKGIEGYPLTFSFPTYFSVGPESYWGRGGSALTEPDGNFGVVSTSADLTVPLNFIPVKYGFWHANVGVQYYYIANDALLRAGGLASGNTDRNFVRGYAGFGVNF